MLGGFDEFDPVAVRDLMTFDYIPAPRTIRSGVQKLEPGSRFDWTTGSGRATHRTLLEPAAADRRLARASRRRSSKSSCRVVVKRQMVSDVPIGVFLSGGIDSSLLVALMARHSDSR